MKIIKTQDGSFTAYSEAAQEHYHSISGALEEAFQKHVNAVGVEDGFRILDFCFGLGYNSIAATKDHKNLQIFSLENDLEIVKAIEYLEVPDSIRLEFAAFRDLAEKLEITDSQNNTVKLIIGDALQTIDLLPKEFFDRVFFDPFSPQINTCILPYKNNMNGRAVIITKIGKKLIMGIATIGSTPCITSEKIGSIALSNSSINDFKIIIIALYKSTAGMDRKSDFIIGPIMARVLSRSTSSL